MSDSLAELARAVATLPPEHHGFAYFDPTVRAGHGANAVVPRQGRLSGWIIPAKDLSDVAGMPTTMGSIHRKYQATETDVFIEAYQRQGALVPGKTLSPELGLTAYTEPVGLPHPDNPRLPGHTPGGSSGGAAVMVARGLVRAAHASDGGGSIRIPAACCGVIGYKPPHSTEYANPVAQGFITASLADAAFLHNITPTFHPLRVGVLFEPVHAEVEVAEHMLVAVDQAAAVLSELGCPVHEVRRPYGDAPFTAFHNILALRATKIEGEGSPLINWLKDHGLSLSERQGNQAKAEFMSVKSQLLRAWDIDVLLCPTLAFDPPKIGYFSAMPPEEDFYAQTQWTPWGTMFNMAGLAALSMPYRHVSSSIHLGAIRATPEELFGLAGALS
jgi:hypothetical protein